MNWAAPNHRELGGSSDRGEWGGLNGEDAEGKKGDRLVVEQAAVLAGKA